MADEAFALSPISARAALPSDEDYAAISEAFMETSRGRWFLTEYAKRNRNADTSMVLDAVARIEQSLAAQKEENLQRDESLHREESLAAQQQAAAAAAENRLNEALAAIRGAVEAARESSAEALDSLALEQRLAPVRKGARVLREIAWRLREIGNDGRICDLIDSQVAVIESGAEQISSDGAKAALSAAFAALEGQLAEFGGDGLGPAPAAETKAAAPSPAPQEMPPAAVAETMEASPVQRAADDAPPASLAAPAEAAVAEAKAVLADAAAAPPVGERAGVDADAQDAFPQDAFSQDAAQDALAQDADAEDEALLDAIAMEMGAPDPITDEEIAEAVAEQGRVHEPASVEPEVAVIAPEAVAAPMAPPVQQAVQPPPQPVAEAVAIPAMEVSLGSTIIASGMLRKPAVAANDPLAPIRRMSQAEKIAFFS